MTEGGSIEHPDLPGLDARGAELQRDGRGQGVARSRPCATWRATWARSKIRVNAISAGAVKTASARAIKDFSTMLDSAPDARAAAAQHRPRRSRRHRGVPGQRPGPRRHRQLPVRRCRHADHGFLTSIIEVRSPNMKVEVVLTEADIAQEFAEAIEARDLPEKFFFWFPRSAAEWAALAERRGAVRRSCRRPGRRSCADGAGAGASLRRQGAGDQLRRRRRRARPPAVGRARRCRQRLPLLSGGRQPDDARNGLRAARTTKTSKPSASRPIFRARST